MTGLSGELAPLIALRWPFWGRPARSTWTTQRLRPREDTLCGLARGVRAPGPRVQAAGGRGVLAGQRSAESRRSAQASLLRSRLPPPDAPPSERPGGRGRRGPDKHLPRKGRSRGGAPSGLRVTHRPRPVGPHQPVTAVSPQSLLHPTGPDRVRPGWRLVAAPVDAVLASRLDSREQVPAGFIRSSRWARGLASGIGVPALLSAGKVGSGLTGAAAGAAGRLLTLRWDPPHPRPGVPSFGTVTHALKGIVFTCACTHAHTPSIQKTQTTSEMAHAILGSRSELSRSETRKVRATAAAKSPRRHGSDTWWGLPGGVLGPTEHVRRKPSGSGWAWASLTITCQYRFIDHHKCHSHLRP